MKNNSTSQLELFSETGNGSGKNFVSCSSFLGYIRNHERVIILMFCFIITGLLSFSFGVEKGKQLIHNVSYSPEAKPEPAAEIKNTLSPPQKINNLDNSSIAPQTQIKEPQIKKVKLPAVNFKQGKENYTIQLASYKNKLQLEKEIAVLKHKGLAPIILKKGKYLVLCVGKFTAKEKAETLLTDLKTNYQGCYIRRL